MHGDRRILEIWKRNIALDELPQIGGIDQIIRTTHESEHASKRYWKHIMSPQSAPNLFQFVDAFSVWKCLWIK
jgi:hypothetical protein